MHNEGPRWDERIGCKSESLLLKRMKMMVYITRQTKVGLDMDGFIGFINLPTISSSNGRDWNDEVSRKEEVMPWNTSHTVGRVRKLDSRSTNPVQIHGKSPSEWTATLDTPFCFFS